VAERPLQWPSAKPLVLLGLSLELFRRRRDDETILLLHETIFGFWRRIPETSDGYQATNKYRRTAPSREIRREVNADRQFHPRFRLRGGRLFDGRFG
jgi:hypothetical protein